MNGIRQTPLAPGQVVPAPTTGVYLGRNKSGPLTLRLFRPRGTRIAVCSGGYVAQLITLRAAMSGAAVQVVSNREALWAPALRYGADARLLPATGHPTPVPAGPRLVVDDRPDEPRALGEIGEWQCLLDIRSLGHDGHPDSDMSRVASVGHADVAFFGTLGTDLAAVVGRAYSLGDAAASLTVVPPHAVAVVARGSVQLVRLEATPGERELLRA